MSPDRDKFKPVAVLHKGKLRDVVLLEECKTGERWVGQHLKLPANTPMQAVLPRLQEQAARLKTLAHPRLPRFHSYVQTELEQHWFLFEYIDGFPLSQYQDDTGALTADDIAFWLFHMLEAIDYLHGQDNLLGGFTPGDLVINSNGLHLVEMGLLERILPEACALARSPLHRSLMAPEDRDSIHYTPSGDIFSAGAVAWWLISGSPPQDVAQMPVRSRKEQLLALRPDLLPPVAEVVARLIQFRPEARCSSAWEALEFMAWAISSRMGAPPSHTRTYQLLVRQDTPLPAAMLRVRSDVAGSVHQPPAPPAPIPDEGPAAPAPASFSGVLREAVLDARWRLIHSRPTALATLLAVLLVLAGVARVVETRRTSAMVRPLMTVETGSILVNRAGTDWSPATRITEPCLVVAVQRDGHAEIAFTDGGRLQLSAPRTTFRLEAVTDDRVSLTFLNGAFKLAMGNQLTGLVSVPGGKLTCSPGASLAVTVGTATEPGTVVSVLRSGVLLTAGHQHDLNLVPGRSIAMGGSHAEPEFLP